MPLTSLFLFAGTLFVVSATPGPGVAALTSRVIASGWRSALPFVAALWLGDVIWLALAAFGLGVIAKSFALGFFIVKLAGAAYLLYLAWQMWSAPSLVGAATTPPASSALSIFATGLAIILGNPKVMMFYLALLPAIVDLAALTPAGLAELAATMIVVNAAVDTGYIVLASQARALLRSPAAIRIANRFSALAMTGAAVAIAMDAT